MRGTTLNGDVREIVRKLDPDGGGRARRHSGAVRG
jgi:hypothetical protein